MHAGLGGQSKASALHPEAEVPLLSPVGTLVTVGTGRSRGRARRHSVAFTGSSSGQIRPGVPPTEAWRAHITRSIGTCPAIRFVAARPDRISIGPASYGDRTPGGKIWRGTGREERWHSCWNLDEVEGSTMTDGLVY